MTRSKKFSRASAPPLPLVSPASGEPPAGAPVTAPEFWESHVARRLGLAREKISALRAAHLSAPTDFQMRCNAVVYTAAGMTKLERMIVADGASLVPPPGTPMLDSATSEKLEAIFRATPHPAPALASCAPTRAHFKVLRTTANPKLIYAVSADEPTARPVLVHVKHSAHFHPKLRPFECQLGADRQWRYLGKLPRSLGRW